MLSSKFRSSLQLGQIQVVSFFFIEFIHMSQIVVSQMQYEHLSSFSAQSFPHIKQFGGFFDISILYFKFFYNIHYYDYY